jgi:cytoskeletal protein CcmA (bactofilin family)
MFGNSSKSRPHEPSLIGKGALIEGTVRVSGPVQVDGRIDGGLISDGHVAIGPTGSVSGELVAAELVVAGSVDGRVSVSGYLHVTAGGSACGEVHYGSLQVDRGGVLSGSTLQDEHTPRVDAALVDAESMPPLPPATRSPAVG